MVAGTICVSVDVVRNDGRRQERDMHYAHLHCCDAGQAPAFSRGGKMGRAAIASCAGMELSVDLAYKHPCTDGKIK